MSLTITMSGHESALESCFQPTLDLDDNKYECGLLYFSVTNSVPNIDTRNNKLHYDNGKEIIIPTGTYDLFDLEEYILKHVDDCEIKLKPNKNNLKCYLYCSKTVNFEKQHSIGQLLGFEKRILDANKWHESENLVNILPLSVIRIECDLIHGSYINGSLSHVIHEFVPNVPPGHCYIEVPNNIIYYPINKNAISSVSIKIVDEHSNLIDFRKERVQLRLHLRRAK